MKKTIRFEVEEGNTQCSYEGYPIYNSCEPPCDDIYGIDCGKYNLLTLKFIGENDENKI